MFSFECKMNVMWRERYKKFAFYAPDVAVQTDCTFEDYMWHHVMVTFDDDGVGKLFVDGEQQYLENVDGTPVGKTFKTCMYPQLNVPATLDSPGSCTPIDPNPAAASPTCQFAIGKSCNAASHMGAWLLGFDGLVDEVVVYDRDLSAGNAVVADIMFKMPLYLLPRELEVPSGIQKDLTQGRVLYAKFNRVPCQMPELPINTTDAYDHAGLTAYIPDGSGGYTLDDFGDRMTINELSRQAIVYTGVPFKPPEIVSVASGGVTNQLPLGGKGASKLVITGAGFAKSPFAKCALIQPKPMEEGSSPDSWEPRYGPGLEPSIYNDYFLDAEDGSFSRKGLTVYSYSESGYMKLRMIRDDVALSDASVVEYTDPSLRTKQSNIAPYYHEFGYRRTAYAPEFGELGPRVSHSMYEQVTCDMPAAAFPSDRYTLVVSNDGGLTGASSNFIEVSEMSLRFDGRTNVTLPRPWTAWRPFAISFWFRPDKEAQADATLLDLGSGSTTARLSYTVTGSTTGYLQYTNGDDSASRVIMRPVDTSRGGFRVVELWHHVMVKVISRSDGIKVSVYLDGDIMYGTAVSQLSTPVPGVIGSGFIGNIDEVKIFKDPPAHGAELQRAFSREPEGAPLLWNYYRFNSDFSSFAADGNRLPAVCRGGLATSCTFQASEAPWEPSILYTINGRPASAMGFSSMKGNETIEVTGYNLAPSAFLTCTWGAKGPADAYEINTVFTGGNQDVCNDGVPEDPAIRPPPPPPMVGGGGRRHLLQQVSACLLCVSRASGHPVLCAAPCYGMSGELMRFLLFFLSGWGWHHSAGDIGPPGWPLLHRWFPAGLHHR